MIGDKLRELRGKINPSLKGALPSNYFSRLTMDVSKLASLLDTVNNIDILKYQHPDLKAHFIMANLHSIKKTGYERN